VHSTDSRAVDTGAYIYSLAREKKRAVIVTEEPAK